MWISELDFIPTKYRHRSTKKGGVYDDPRNDKQAEKIRAAYKGPKLEGPVMVTVLTYAPIPDSRPKKVESEFNTYKPDIDNTIKAIFDALNGVAWNDDRQVIYVTARKNDRRRGMKEATVFSVSEVKE